MLHKTAFLYLMLVGLAASACRRNTLARGEQAVAKPAEGAEPHENNLPEDAAHESRRLQDRIHGAGREHGTDHGPHGVEDSRAERAIGDTIRDFTVEDSTGQPFQLASLRRTETSKGKIAVLTFWCATCSSCRQIEESFDEAAREHAQDAAFLMVDSNYTDSAQRVNEFRSEKELDFRVLMDPKSEIARHFGAQLTTTTAVLDAEGRLRYYGAFSGAERAVRSLMAGEEVAVPRNPGGG